MLYGQGLGFVVYVQERKRRGFLPRSSLVFRVNGSRECNAWLSALEVGSAASLFVVSIPIAFVVPAF